METMTQEEKSEREMTTFYSLLNSAAWLIDDLVSSKDPYQNIKDNAATIDMLLGNVETWLNEHSEKYVESLRRFGGKDAYIALWMKGRGMAVDLAYYCSKCRHEQTCNQQGRRFKDPTADINTCFERKLQTRDN